MSRNKKGSADDGSGEGSGEGGSGEGGSGEGGSGEGGADGGFNPSVVRSRSQAEGTGNGTDDDGEEAEARPARPAVAGVRKRAGGRKPRVATSAAQVLTPEMIAQMANVATVLYSTPFQLLARVTGDERLNLSPEELTGINAANQLGVAVAVPILGDQAPLYFWGACLAAPLLMRADLIYVGIKKIRKENTVAKLMAVPAAPSDDTNKET